MDNLDSRPENAPIAHLVLFFGPSGTPPPSVTTGFPFPLFSLIIIGHQPLLSSLGGQARLYS